MLLAYTFESSIRRYLHRRQSTRKAIDLLETYNHKFQLYETSSILRFNDDFTTKIKREFFPLIFQYNRSLLKNKRVRGFYLN